MDQDRIDHLISIQGAKKTKENVFFDKDRIKVKTKKYWLFKAEEKQISLSDHIAWKADFFIN